MSLRIKKMFAYGEFWLRKKYLSFECLFHELPSDVLSNMPSPKTTIMLLQEFALKKKISVPEYGTLMYKSKKNENEFHIEVNVAGISATGIGRTKQMAKHNAAFHALETLIEKGIYDLNDPDMEFEPSLHKTENESSLSLCVNFVGFLQECCAHNKLPIPFIRQVSDVGPPHSRQFTYECKVGTLTTQDTQKTKKQAKQMAAKLMLEKVRRTVPDLIMSDPDLDKSLLVTENEISGKTSFEVVPNRTAKITEYPDCFKILMAKRNLQAIDFKGLLRRQDEEGLKKILEKFELMHEFVKIEEESEIIVALNLNLDTPFTVLGMGKSEDEAKDIALKRTMESLKAYILAASCH